MGEIRILVRNVAAAWFCLLSPACTGPESTPADAREQAGSAGARIAAGVPDTEVYLARLDWQGGFPRAGPLQNVSNRAGYDNQPRFLADGRSFVYSSIRDGRQSDIWRYLIEDAQLVPFAETPESEYSPTPMPDGTGISVVRVEADGSQRLWRFAAANAQPAPLLPYIGNVGYHAWLDDDAIALFIVDEPSLLVVFDIETGQQKHVARDIGRGLGRIPGEPALAFISREDAVWRVVRYDFETSSLAELIETPPGSEDFAWTPAGGLFMGAGMQLMYWDGRPDTGWRVAADYSAEGSGRITRLDVSPDGRLLALVVAPEVQE